MQYNVIVAIPSFENVVEEFKNGFRNTIYAALGSVDKVTFIQNSAEFYSLMYGFKGLEYNVCIVFDVPGERQEYIDLLRLIDGGEEYMKVWVLLAKENDKIYVVLFET